MITSHVLRRDLPQQRGYTPLDVAFVAVALAWTLFVFRRSLGATGELRVSELIALPGALVGVRLFKRGTAGPGLTLASAITSIVALALLSDRFVIQNPALVIAAPALAVTSLVVVRRPTLAVVILFICTGTFGSITAFLSVSVSPIVDLILGGLWLATFWWYLFHVRERPMWLWPGVALVALYVAISLFQVLTSANPPLALRSFRLSAWYLMAMLLVAYAPWFQARRGQIARGFVFVALLVGSYATFRWIFGQSATETSYSLSQSGNEVLDGNRLRLLGSFVTGKQLAFWTACVIPFCLACALTFTGRWRVVALAACGTCAIAMFGTDVRLALVALVPAILVVIGLYQVAQGFAGLHLGTTLAVSGLIALMGVGGFALTLGRLSSTPDRYKVLVTDPTRDPSYQQRVFKWGAALKDIRHHPLGQGQGVSGLTQKRFGRFVNVSSAEVDNSYLKIALEQGFPLMIFYFVALAALGTGLATRAVRTHDRERAGLAIGAVGAVVVLAVFMFAGTYIEGLPVLAGWLIVGLGVAQFSSVLPQQGSRRTAEAGA